MAAGVDCKSAIDLPSPKLAILIRLPALCLAASLLALPLVPARAGTVPPVAPPPCAALSFDDGPEMTLTPRLLDILAAEKVPATFFVVGQRLGYSPGLVKRAFAEGHEIGNHTWDHRRLTDLPDDEAVAEIARTDAAIMAETGERPALIRPPWGVIDTRVEAALRKAGLWRTIALWDLDTLDWLDDDSKVTTLLASGVPPGSVIMLHDIHASTIAAVPAIIRNLKARGFRFATVSGLAACRGGLPEGEASAVPPRPAGPALTEGPARNGFAHALEGFKPLQNFLQHGFGS